MHRCENAMKTAASARRLAEIRQAIAAGTYETPDRISAAVDALLADLEAQAESNGDGLPRAK